MKPKILIVDDKTQNLFSLAKILQKVEAEVVQTTSPFDALNFSLEYDFVLAIVDIQMPEMDGYELVELLRSNQSTAKLPVIFVSAIYSDEYHHHKAYEAGAVDFLSKPFNPDILLSKVRVFLELYNQRLELQQAVNQLNETNIILAKRATQLEISSKVGRQVTSILNMDELLNQVVNLISAKFDSYFVAIWSLVERNEENRYVKEALILQAGVGRDGIEHLSPGTKVLLESSTSILGHTALIATRYYAEDVKQDPHYLYMEALADTQSQLCIPLPIGKRIIGLLDIQSDKISAFNNDDVITLQMLANQIAIALRNAELYSLVQTANDELSKLNADKDKFFSIVAHDLKGPFLPLLGNLELLTDMAESFTPDQIKSMSSSSYRAAKQVFGLLENLLQWARMQMGRMEYKPQQFNLNELVVKTIELLADSATSKGINLYSKIDPDCIIYADERMIDTVIRNLTNNALKFTPESGEVKISANLNGNQVEVSVTDSGVGISQKNIDKLFKIETAHSTKGTDNESGTGLGLIMCQEMVEQNSGKIWIESELGQGTTVRFTVPCQ